MYMSFLFDTLVNYRRNNNRTNRNLNPNRNRNRNRNTMRTMQFPPRMSNHNLNNQSRNSRVRQQYDLNWRTMNLMNQMNNDEPIDIVHNPEIYNSPNLMNNDDPALQVPINANSGNNNSSSMFDVNTNNAEFFETHVNLDNNNYMNINFMNEEQGGALYYSNFIYNAHNIRFNHEELISPMDAEYVLQDILSHYYQNEINNIMNESISNAQNQCHENSEEVKQIMAKNMETHVYGEVKHIVKNDTCPISMEMFDKNESIVLFSPCKHGICESHKEQFLTLFKKCPLCNCNLLED